MRAERNLPWPSGPVTFHPMTHRRSARMLTFALFFALALSTGCRAGGTGEKSPPPPPTSVAGPPLAELDNSPLSKSILRGRAILLATRDSLPDHVGNALRCVNCHLDEGRRPVGTWIGVYGRFPQYNGRAGRVITIEDRVNGCFQRSMNGTPLEDGGPDMRDIVAYLAFLSRGETVTGPPAKAPDAFAGMHGDSARGAAVFTAICSRCHGPDGLGTAVAPPLWGPTSFNIGAGMARPHTAARFIRANMPFDKPGTLTDQQALDAATFVDSHGRPDFPPKAHDWPFGGAPADVPYAVRPPTLPPGAAKR